MKLYNHAYPLGALYYPGTLPAHVLPRNGAKDHAPTCNCTPSGSFISQLSSTFPPSHQKENSSSPGRLSFSASLYSRTAQPSLLDRTSVSLFAMDHRPQAWGRVSRDTLSLPSSLSSASKQGQDVLSDNPTAFHADFVFFFASFSISSPETKSTALTTLLTLIPIAVPISIPSSQSSPVHPSWPSSSKTASSWRPTT